MKYVFRIVILAIILICGKTVSAQRYVADPFKRDSVAVMNLTADKGVGTEAFRIAKGDTVNVLAQVEGFTDYGVLTSGGREYAVHVRDFRIVDADGAEDPWETMDVKWRTPEGRYYSTLTPYLIILGLVVCALLAGLVGRRVRLVRRVALIFIPLLIIAACYLEVCAYLALGTDMFWWCDKDRFGFWGSMLRVLPFTLVVVGQLASYPVYTRLMTRDSDEDAPTGALLPMGISFLAAIPVVAIVLLVCALFHMGKPMQNIVGTCIFVAIVGFGSLTSITLNVKLLGFFKGIWLSLFGAIYIVGAMIAVLGFGIALWHLLIQVIVTVVPWAFLLFAAAHAGDSTENNPTSRKEKQWSTADKFLGLDEVDRRQREQRRKIGLPD